MDRLSSARSKNTRQIQIRLLAIGAVVAIIALLIIFSPRFFTGNDDLNKDLVTLSSTPIPALSATLADFREALDNYEKNREPQLEKINPGPWNQQQLQQITEYKNMALRAFSIGDYTTAISHISHANDNAVRLIDLARQKFSLLMADAVNWFDKNEYQTARKTVNAALEYNNSDSAALKLKERISILPEVISLLDKAAIARSENRPTEERDLLRRVVRLDPARTDQGKRVALLNKLLTKQEFQRNISRGLAAVDAGDLTTAAARLANAQKIFPANSATKLLQQSVAGLRHDQGLKNIMAEARRLEKADDWPGAAQALRRALTMEPDNLDALNENRVATSMVTALGQIRDLLAQPERITSPEVLGYAKSLLDNLEKLKPLSQTLENQMSALNKLTISAVMPVEVNVISDNKTEISIRNIGRLNRGFNQVIRLNPGIYKFEGRRNGYRSKIVTLNIPLINPGKTLEVRIVSDEQVSP